MIGTVYSEPQANKPYKVCPEIVKAKDTPCRVIGPTSSIVQRDIVREDPRDKQIKELEERVIELEALIKQLAKNNESTR